MTKMFIDVKDLNLHTQKTQATPTPSRVNSKIFQNQTVKVTEVTRHVQGIVNEVKSRPLVRNHGD